MAKVPNDVETLP